MWLDFCGAKGETCQQAQERQGSQVSLRRTAVYGHVMEADSGRRFKIRGYPEDLTGRS